MEFDTTILDLYFSNNKSRIQEIINHSFHRNERFSSFVADESKEAIHTGIYFDSQNKKPMELLYSIGTREFIYQQSSYAGGDCYSPMLGEVMHWCLTQDNGDDYGHFISYHVSNFYPYCKYCSCYDINLKTFAQPQILPIEYGRATCLCFELKGKGIIKNGRKHIGEYIIGCRHRSSILKRE